MMRDFDDPGFGPAWEGARRAGFDMDLLEENLGLSPAERLLRHENAVITAQRLRQAMLARDDAAAADHKTSR
jgi:hypothetical protein